VLHALSVVPFILLAPFVLPAYRGSLRLRSERTTGRAPSPLGSGPTEPSPQAERGPA
jgi:hypothetical protein